MHALLSISKDAPHALKEMNTQYSATTKFDLKFGIASVFYEHFECVEDSQSPEQQHPKHYKIGLEFIIILKIILLPLQI